MVEKLHSMVNAINGPLWNFLLYFLLGVGLLYTIMTAFVQVRLFPRSIKEMFRGRRNQDDHQREGRGITPFQAFVTGIASRVGVGNIAGVAIAVSLGGPGAVFWMWITAVLGMSSAFAESSLAQLFKVRDTIKGEFRGGPAYYITNGIKQRWLGVLFALSLILTFGFIFNAVQANSIVAATESAWNWNKYIVGTFLVILTAPIIFGGIRRVSRVAEVVVPIMAIFYLLMAIFIMADNISALPHVIGLIFSNAFQLDAAGGGILGGIISQAMMLGIKRGLFSNEAGMGSAPNAAAAAAVKHPVSQGLIQMLGVFVDTIIVCSCTAFILLLSDVSASEGLAGVQLTQAAVVSHVGRWGADFIAIVLFMFAFSSIIGNYAYAESNMQFIKNNPLVLAIFRMLVLAMVYFGAVNSVPLVWDMADSAMGFMAIINLYAILHLSPYVFMLMRDYQNKLKAGEDPVFRLSEHPKMAEKIKSDIW